MRQKGLVRGDEDIGEGEQAREDVVLDDVIAMVLKEELRLFLIDVECDRANLLTLEALRARLIM
jgi:hypothetical protein